MTTPKELADQSIRNQLALRWNATHGCPEVFTTIHGTGVFRWYKITDAVAVWYRRQFPEIKMQHEKGELFDETSGAINKPLEVQEELHYRIED